MSFDPNDSVEYDGDFGFDPVLIAMGYDVVQAFTAALKTRKLFGLEHQNTQKSTDNFIQRMTALANKAGQTKLNIQPGGLLMFNEPILTVQKPQDSPLFPLLLDGIGGLSFSAGILREELLTLIETVASEFEDDMEDSVGTILWEANLPHIELLKLPALGSGFGESNDTFVEEFDDLVATAIAEAIDADEDVSQWSGAVRLDNLSASQAMELHDLASPDEAASRSDITLQTTSAVVRFRESINDPVDNIPVLYAQAALQAVANTNSNSEILAARDGLVSIMLDMIAAGKPQQAVVLAKHSLKLLQRVEETQLMEPDRAAEASTAFREGLQYAENHVESLKALWPWLPDQAQLLLVQDAITDSDTKTLRRIRVVATKVGPQTARFLKYQTNRVPQEIAGELMLLSAHVLGADSVEALHQGLNHRDDKVRMMAFRMLVKINIQDAALQARRLLTDPERLVRKDALTIIQKVKDSGAIFALRQALESDAFKVLTQPEKREFFVCAGYVNPAEGLPLVRNAAAKSDVLARNTVRETRTAAIEALGMLKDRGAKHLLNDIASGMTTSGSARTAAQEALRKI